MKRSIFIAAIACIIASIIPFSAAMDYDHPGASDLELRRRKMYDSAKRDKLIRKQQAAEAQREQKALDKQRQEQMSQREKAKRETYYESVAAIPHYRSTNSEASNKGGSSCFPFCGANSQTLD